MRFGTCRVASFPNLLIFRLFQPSRLLVYPTLSSTYLTATNLKDTISLKPISYLILEKYHILPSSHTMSLAITSPPPQPSSASSKKRRFQVPITSYFSAADTQSENGAASHFNYSAPTYSVHPTLTHNVQSSLLNVGMRVRKAVPGGYQTTAPKTDPIIPYGRNGPATLSSSQSHNSTPTPAYSELAPICGMHKIGNLAVQSYPNLNYSSTETTRPPLDEEFIPPSSQESTDSSCETSSVNPHKRRWEKVDETPVVLPRAGMTRIIQTPRGPKSKTRALRVAGARQSIVAQDDSNICDFEDATFLRSREEVDNEIEMSGV